MRQGPVAGGSEGSRSRSRFFTGRPGGVQESPPLSSQSPQGIVYNEVLEQKIGLIQGVVRAKRSRRLPVVLTNGFGQIHNVPPRRGTPVWVPYADGVHATHLLADGYDIRTVRSFWVTRM